MSSVIDPDHHLWKNGRLWWVAYTVHLPGWRKARFRQSLETDDLIEARSRRDRLFRLWEQDGAPGRLSLRFAPRSARCRGRGGSLHCGAALARDPSPSSSLA